MTQQSKSDTSKKPRFTPDWLVRGTLTKIGDIFDRLTGRGYKPSSTLATSELIERMKVLLDSEAQDENGRKFVPHNIKLKMQWDKFSTDSEDSLRALEHEFLTAAVDHVNDKRYYTRGPFNVEAKPDYFTQGVKLFVSFDKFSDDESDAAISVAVPGVTNEAILESPAASDALVYSITIRFSLRGEPFERSIDIKDGERFSIGRTKENRIAIDDPSLSKYHASLIIDRDGKLMVADTGSTNGTFVNGERIAYGKALAITERDKVRFGLVEAAFIVPPKPVFEESVEEIPATKTFAVGEFEFTKRIEPTAMETTIAAATKEPLNPVPTDAPQTTPVLQKNELDLDSIAPQPDLTADSIEIKEDELDIP